MNKKINILNIVLSVIILGFYVFNLLTKGESYLLSYKVNILYIGAGVGIVLLFLSLLKLLRNSVWMDIIFMVYLLMFIGFNYYSIYFGKKLNIYGVFLCYPVWVKYLLIVFLLLNILCFILSFSDNWYGK